MGGLDSLPPGGWWLVGGLLLLALELMAPGVFLVFLGAAAIATGAFTLIFDLGMPAQLGLFAIYSVVSVLVGKRIYARPVVSEDDGTLNERSRQLIGRKVTVTRAIVDGDGRVKLGDGEWTASGDFNASEGERLIVTGVRGNRLIVERPDALPPR
ncbi:NfeD family protein [Sphingomicrobium marinum]|uniref:NfeD family protein n=1 Tax=Sphingomicrobium marinum TaxID=1227950 RepID=UPI00223FB71B|nr:NfeD family protein [Sphingomicrobium marinum]